MTIGLADSATETTPPPTHQIARPPGLDDVARAFQANPFRPHSWLKGAHKQTLIAYFWPRSKAVKTLVNDERRLFQVDADTQVLALCRWQPDRQAAPTIILIHGLEGSHESVYMRSMAVKAFALGFNVVRLNQRNCGDTEHLTPTLYNSGMHGDFMAVVRELIDRDGLDRIFLTGISMSGNMVLQLAGEAGADLPPQVAGICAVSPSVDLKACADAAGKPRNRLYRWQFVASLKQRMQRKAKHFPDTYDLARLKEVKFVRDFDHIYTTLHGGFTDVDDYYSRCSAIYHIARIAVPTLIIHAEDDPVVPYHPLADAVFQQNPNILLVTTETGGHVGFLGLASDREDRFWAENRVIDFCRIMAEQPGAERRTK
jgi:predicted alpha/beta-fold hydrolase